MRKENLFKSKATKTLVAALAVAMATAVVPMSADAAKATNVTIAKGDAKKLASNLKNAKTSNKKVVKVTKKGKITAVKAGTATITANQKGKKVTYKVKVKKAPTVSKKSVSVKAGNKKTITVNKNGAKYLGVSFKSSKPAVAKVNKNGKITGVKKGTAKITVTIKGYTKKYKSTVTVKVTEADNTGNEPTTPTEPTTPDEPNTPVAETDPVIKEASVLKDGTYNSVTITSDVAAYGTVSLGNSKISKLYIESGSEYNVDASQAEIEEVEVIEAGAKASAERIAKAPRINFGNNTKIAKTKVTVKAAVYLAGTAKAADVSVAASVNVYVEIQVGNITISGNGAKVSLNGIVDNLVISSSEAAVAVKAEVKKVVVQGEKANLIVNEKVKVGEVVVEETAKGALIEGTGTVENLTVNAEETEVKTAVTTVKVAETVTTAKVGGTEVKGGTELKDVTAVAGQTVKDPVSTVTDPSSTNNGDSSDNSGSNNNSGSSSSGGSTVATTRTTTASVKVTKDTTYLTAKIGTQEVTVTKKALQDYFADTTKPLVFQINGKDTTYQPTITTKPGEDYDVTVNVTYVYNYTIQVTGKDLNSATVTVTATVPTGVTDNIVLTADKVAIDSEKVTIDSTKNSATLTVGNATLTVTKDQAKQLAEGNTVTVDGVVLTPATTKDTIEGGFSAANDIAAGNAVIGGNNVTLHVIGYRAVENKKEVTIYVTASAAPGTAVTITAE